MSGYTSGPTLEDDSKGSSILREAERLLSQFTSGSSRPPRGRSGPVTHGHTTFQTEQINDAWRTPRSERVERSSPNSSLPQPPSTPNSNTPPSSHTATRHSTPQPQRRTRQESLRRSVTVSNASRTHVERTQTPEQPAVPVSQSATSSKSSFERDSTIPLHTRRSPPRMSSSEYRSSSSPSRSPDRNAKKTAVRRSGRSRNAPVTYNVRTLFGLDKNEFEKNLSESPHGSEDDRPSWLPHPPLATLDPFSVRNQTETGPWNGKPNLQRLLHDRELRGSRGPHGHLRAAVSSDLKPWRHWKGASNDVIVLAWSPEGTRFAAGATAHSDEYNRGNNLIFGDLVHNTLRELPDHWVPRPASSNASDHRLFTSVSAMQWVGQRLYTASFDQNVKIWDAEAHPRPSCLQTLHHTSPVVVMALSNWIPNIVATGAQSFGLWDLQDGQTPTYRELPIERNTRQKANIDLVPTTLAWGQSAETKRFLVGGMTERTHDDFTVPPCGHLGMWKIDESSISTRKLSPDSQNIFDLKWHPFLPRFMTASTCSPAMSLPHGSRSVVHVYDYIPSDDKILVTSQFPCPALDVNEVTFCPMNSAYVTASCTDGSTYVWDNRKPGKILHRLHHGDSLIPLNHDYPREHSDFGVRVALWGSTIDQFYTGGSDGYLKQWDIRRSTEDALVANTASLDEGIVSGLFSEDKSNLLIGDYGGGIHVLSSGPCSDPEPAKFSFEKAPEPSSEVRGIPLVKEYLSTGQLIMHSIYGAVQGPNYQGPFAPWARDLTADASVDQVRRTPLLECYRLRQFDGPPVHDRRGLDKESRQVVQKHFNLANARNTRPVAIAESTTKKKKKNKRKREHYIGRDSHDEEVSGRSASMALGYQRSRKEKEKEKRKRKKPRQANIPTVDDTVIDLTLDSDPDPHPDPEMPIYLSSEPTKKLEENLEEDYWWPDSGHVEANIRGSDGD